MVWSSWDNMQCTYSLRSCESFINKKKRSCESHISSINFIVLFPPINVVDKIFRFSSRSIFVEWLEIYIRIHIRYKVINPMMYQPIVWSQDSRGTSIYQLYISYRLGAYAWRDGLAISIQSYFTHQITQVSDNLWEVLILNQLKSAATLICFYICWQTEE